MIPATRLGHWRPFFVRCGRHNTHGFKSSSIITSAQPNPPLNLDPSMRAMLNDVDMALSHHKPRPTYPPRELEVFPMEQVSQAEILVHEPEEDLEEEYWGRKSPAAHFGSQQIGAVVLPFQLQTAINTVISGVCVFGTTWSNLMLTFTVEIDKPQLHRDAKRLFHNETAEAGSGEEWETQYDTKYRSYRQASRHLQRDGAAFASVALPAHYSAIVSVLDHVKRRLEPEWKVERVYDWGAGTGSGLWFDLISTLQGII